MMDGNTPQVDGVEASSIIRRPLSNVSPDVEARNRELSIKKRIVRPKRIRRHDEEDGLSSPGAGPSSRPRTRSPSITAKDAEADRPVPTPSQKLDTDAAHGPPTKPKTLPPPPRCPYAPTRRSHPPLTSCRSVYNYTRLNHIEEGTYGVVFRAKCNETNEIYALKKLKLEEEKQGFPITSLREVMALMIGGAHENVVGIKEIVVGDTLNQCIHGLSKRRLS